MPQPLRRKSAPIDWSVELVANHPVLTSGVGACIVAYAQAEALMGVYLAYIQWKNPGALVAQWADRRTAASKLEFVQEQAEIRSAGVAKMTRLLLDSYIQVAKERAKLAHGVFGVITDRSDEFAWRNGGSPAKAHATGMAATHWGVVEQATYVYKSSDFARLAQQCSNICSDLGHAVKGLTFLNGFEQALSSPAGSGSTPCEPS